MPAASPAAVLAPATGAARYVTLPALRAIMPRLARADRWVAPLVEACDRFSINSRLRVAAFLAQLAHESGELSRLEENLNYSAEALRRQWPARFSWADSIAFGRVDGPGGHPAQPARIAELAYGARDDLGNTQAGDGAVFIGRGAIQTTGRANYERVADRFGLRLLEVGQWLMSPEGAALSAALYWSDRKLNPLADAGSFDEVSRRVNGARTVAATAGLAERRAYYKRALDALPV